MKRLSLFLCILLMLSLTGCGMAAKQESIPATIPPLYEETEPATEPAADQAQEEAPLPTGFEVVTTPEETVTTPSETEPLSQEVAPPAVSEGEDGSAALISTKYYDIILPEAWNAGSCYQTRELANGGYTVRIYESQSYWELGGGELCTLMLTPTDDESYKSLPNYKLLAALDTPDGSFYLIVVIPSKAQLKEGTEDTYNAMAAELMDVLYTIQPKDGIEMAMP